MTKDFSNNLEGFIRLVLLLFSYNCFSQILPSTIGVHHKKESETQINYALAFVGNGDRIEFSTATSSINNNCASCYFSIEKSGDNISNSDWIKFENVSLRDGYYAIASTETEL